MSAGTCIFFCSTLLLAAVFVSVSADHKNITVQSGQNIILPCQAPDDKGSIRVVAWTKPDLQNKNVYLYVDRRFDLEDQNPSFKNRVDLQDRQMKNGDVSLILNNVTINDAGTYECGVTQKKDLSPYTTTTITLDLDVINSRDLPVGRSVSGSSELAIDHKNITVQSGQNIILPCQALRDKGDLRAVAWTKPDLQNKNVYLYRDGRFDAADQNPSFKNRVDLQDRQMKDGDVSLILKDVVINDAGKYECSVTQKKDLSPYTTTITLDLRVINPKGRTFLPVGRSVSGSFGLAVGLYFPVVLLVVAFVF